MPQRALLGFVLAIALASFPVSTAAQAAAEAALTNSLSGAANKETASKLQKQLNQITNNLADRISTATQSQQPPTATRPGMRVPNQSSTSAPPDQSSLSLSIQGAGCRANTKPADSSAIPAASKTREKSSVLCDPRKARATNTEQYGSVVKLKF